MVRILCRPLINPYDSNQSPKTSYKSLKTQIEAYLRFKLMSGKLKKREDVVKELEGVTPEFGENSTLRKLFEF